MTEETTRFYWIRHGEVEERYHQIFGGRIDMNLSDLGRRHAQSVAHGLAEAGITRLVGSPMKRAQQTAQPLALALNLPVLTEADFREVDFGDWTGLRWHDIPERFGVRAFDWLDQLEKDAIPNAERVAAFRQRVLRACGQLEQNHKGERIAVVCHGGVIRMALSIQLNLPLKSMESFEIDYGSISITDVATQRTALQLLNFTPWRIHQPIQESNAQSIQSPSLESR